MPPIDIAARVIANARLSSEYSVLSLAAPEVGARTQPGQFVMVKPAGSGDPLLRRPFSVFEVLRDPGGAITGVSILNKRAGRSTRKLYDLEEGDVVSCLGPLGQPFKPVLPPAHAWMVAGGVGLAPFATLAESLAASRTPTTLFYGARTAEELFYLDFFERLGVSLVLSTENGGRGTRGRVTIPLEASFKALEQGAQAMVYACGPEPMLEAVAKMAARYSQPSQVSVERVMGCGLGGCYSCVVPVKHGDEHANLVRSCISGPVFDGGELVWDE
jgi:dihydroorotate dehydrogenase electron transfer subunit